MKNLKIHIAGSDLSRDEWKKLSGRLGFVILRLLGTKTLANMSTKMLNVTAVSLGEPSSP